MQRHVNAFLTGLTHGWMLMVSYRIIKVVRFSLNVISPNYNHYILIKPKFFELVI